MYTILYRDTDRDFCLDEQPFILKYFPSSSSQRTRVPDNSLVIGRYSVLPFYKELEWDLETHGCKLINSYKDHSYVASLSNWYADFKDITPETWFNLQDIPEKGPFVLKGMTNSMKFQWDTHMYAETKKDAIQVYCRLQDDNLIGSQGICIRRYMPIVRLDSAPRGLPITKEFRVFFHNGEQLSGAFYWSSHSNNLKAEGKYPLWHEVPDDFLHKLGKRLTNKTPFVVADIAQLDNGDWIVVELNDGQMSGLSDNKPDVLYSNLKYVLS